MAKSCKKSGKAKKPTQRRSRSSPNSISSPIYLDPAYWGRKKKGTSLDPVLAAMGFDKSGLGYSLCELPNTSPALPMAALSCGTSPHWPAPGGLKSISVHSGETLSEWTSAPAAQAMTPPAAYLPISLSYSQLRKELIRLLQLGCPAVANISFGPGTITIRKTP